MPTYVYECRKCGHRFEEFQGIKDPPRKRCPKCRGAVRRVLTPGGGLIFKGSGFYITDYRKREYREKARRESEPAAGSKSESGDSSSSSGSPGEKSQAGGDAAQQPKSGDGKRG
ncbi:MAG: zinc ribbon domain-containing protein [Candidatus Eisenbacteria bacterium]|nr:zinc ribbon domain-containing protein [Candidatus Eisenbacteria bacterium]